MSVAFSVHRAGSRGERYARVVGSYDFAKHPYEAPASCYFCKTSLDPGDPDGLLLELRERLPNSTPESVIACHRQCLRNAAHPDRRLPTEPSPISQNPDALAYRLQLIYADGRERNGGVFTTTRRYAVDDIVNLETPGSEGWPRGGKGYIWRVVSVNEDEPSMILRFLNPHPDVVRLEGGQSTGR